MADFLGVVAYAGRTDFGTPSTESAPGEKGHGQITTHQTGGALADHTIYWGEAAHRLDTIDHYTVDEALNIGTVRAGTINLGRSGQNVAMAGDLVVAGNLTVQGDSFVSEPETVLINDNHLYLNNNYGNGMTSNPAAQTGGLVINNDPSLIYCDVGTGGFTAGVASTSNPNVLMDISSTVYGAFYTNDLVQIAGANEALNNGLFEVMTTSPMTTGNQTSRTGTVSVTAGTAAVTGVGTSFTTELLPGDYINIGGEVRKIQSITNDTSLTLATNHVAGASGVSYTLVGAQRTGTVSVTAGTAAVTGVGTSFTTELLPGDYININSEIHQVLSITNDTSLTLATNHTGGASGVNYSLVGARLTIRGVGVTATVEDFTQNQFTTDTTVQGEVRKIQVSVIRCGTDGLWESGFGDETPLTFYDFSTTAGVTLSGAYNNGPSGNTISITSALGPIKLGNYTDSYNAMLFEDDMKLQFGDSGDGEIRYETSGSDATSFVLRAKTETGATPGGDVVIHGGNGDSGDGGDLYLDGGNSSTGAKGVLYLGNRHTSSIVYGSVASASHTLYLPSANGTAFQALQGANSYMLFDTSTPAISFGNVTTNPTFSQLGTGQVSFQGNINASAGVDINADSQSLTIGASGDFSISHDGSDTAISNTTGSLNFSNAANSADPELISFSATNAGAGEGRIEMTADRVRFNTANGLLLDEVDSPPTAVANSGWLYVADDGSGNSELYYKDESGNATTITALGRISGSTYYSVQDMQNLFHSSGWFSGGAISDAGGSTINVTSGTGAIRSTDSRVGSLLFFNWSASNGISISASITYVGVEYNAGAPQVVIKTTDTWDYNTEFPIGTVAKEGSTLHIIQNPQAVGDHANFMTQRAYETGPLARDNRNGGLIIGASTTSESDTAQAGGASTITLAAGANGSDDYYNAWEITITGGTGSGQQRTVSDYVGTTKVATVSSVWATPPDGTSTYTIEIRNPSVTAGALWDRLNRFAISAIDTQTIAMGGAGDTFDAYYRDGGSGWTAQTSQIQWPNLYYDNNSGTLQALSGSYGVLWFYLESDGSLSMLYGQDAYASPAAAEASTPPPSVPPHIQAHGRLIGRILFLDDASTAISVQSVFTDTFSASQAAEHGNLSGLTDDDHLQYVHISNPRTITADLSMGASGTIAFQTGQGTGSTDLLRVTGLSGAPTSAPGTDGWLAYDESGDKLYVRAGGSWQALGFAGLNNNYQANDNTIGMDDTYGAIILSDSAWTNTTAAMRFNDNMLLGFGTDSDGIIYFDGADKLYVKTADSATASASKELWLRTGNNSSTGFTNAIAVWTGDQTNGTLNSQSTGELYLSTGWLTNSSGASGNASLRSGQVNAGGGSSGTAVVCSGNIVAGDGASGSVSFYSGTTAGSGNSGLVELYSGNATSTGNSGNLRLATGSSTGGIKGFIDIDGSRMEFDDHGANVGLKVPVKSTTGAPANVTGSSDGDVVVVTFADEEALWFRAGGTWHNAAGLTGLNNNYQANDNTIGMDDTYGAIILSDSAWTNTTAALRLNDDMLLGLGTGSDVILRFNGTDGYFEGAEDAGADLYVRASGTSGAGAGSHTYIDGGDSTSGTDGILYLGNQHTSQIVYGSTASPTHQLYLPASSSTALKWSTPTQDWLAVNTTTPGITIGNATNNPLTTFSGNGGVLFNTTGTQIKWVTSGGDDPYIAGYSTASLKRIHLGAGNESTVGYPGMWFSVSNGAAGPADASTPAKDGGPVTIDASGGGAGSTGSGAAGRGGYSRWIGGTGGAAGGTLGDGNAAAEGGWMLLSAGLGGSGNADYAGAIGGDTVIKGGDGGPSGASNIGGDGGNAYLMGGEAPGSVTGGNGGDVYIAGGNSDNFTHGKVVLGAEFSVTPYGTSGYDGKTSSIEIGNTTSRPVTTVYGRLEMDDGHVNNAGLKLPIKTTTGAPIDVTNSSDGDVVVVTFTDEEALWFRAGGNWFNAAGTTGLNNNYQANDNTIGMDDTYGAIILSDSAWTNTTAAMRFNDDMLLGFGTGSDLTISFNGTDGYIQGAEDASADLYIRASGTSGAGAGSHTYIDGGNSTSGTDGILYLGNQHTSQIVYGSSASAKQVMYIPDNDSTAMVVQQGVNVYMSFDSTDGTERVRLGKDTSYIDDVYANYGDNEEAFIGYLSSNVFRLATINGTTGYPVTLATGNITSGANPSGLVTITSGSATGGGTGGIDLVTGDDSSGGSTGDIRLHTGTTSSGKGVIDIDGSRMHFDAHTNLVGLRIPTNAGVPSAVTGTQEGDIVWDSTNDELYVYGGSAFVKAGGGTLDNAYDYGGAGAGRTIAADTGSVHITGSGTSTEALRLDVSGTIKGLDINQTGSGSAIDIAQGGDNVTDIAIRLAIGGAQSSGDPTPRGMAIDISAMSALSTANDVFGYGAFGKLNAGAGNSIGFLADANWDYGIDTASNVRVQEDAILEIGSGYVYQLWWDTTPADLVKFDAQQQADNTAGVWFTLTGQQGGDSDDTAAGGAGANVYFTAGGGGIGGATNPHNGGVGGSVYLRAGTGGAAGGGGGSAGGNGSIYIGDITGTTSIQLGNTTGANSPNIFFQMLDNSSSSLVIAESANNYIVFDTTNSAEEIRFYQHMELQDDKLFYVGNDKDGFFYYNSGGPYVEVGTNDVAGGSLDLQMTTGNASAGDSGDIILQTGTATGNRGNIVLDGASIIFDTTGDTTRLEFGAGDPSSTRNEGSVYIDTTAGVLWIYEQTTGWVKAGTQS